MKAKAKQPNQRYSVKMACFGISLPKSMGRESSDGKVYSGLQFQVFDKGNIAGTIHIGFGAIYFTSSDGKRRKRLSWSQVFSKFE